MRAILLATAGRLVVTAAALDIERPMAEAIGIGSWLSPSQHGASAGDEEHLLEKWYEFFGR